MGRSVAYINNSMHEIYVDVSAFDEFDWDDWKDNIIHTLKAKFPSLRECTNEWDGREVSIILDNSHCEIGVAEYSGLASISIRVRWDDYSNQSLAQNWIDTVWNKMEDLIETCSGKVYVKGGSFSNGEGIFNVKTKKVESADLPIKEKGFCHNGMGKTYEF